MALGIMNMRWFMPLFVMVSLVQLQSIQAVNAYFPNSVCEVYQKDGDYILGGMFRLYDSATCDGEVLDRTSFIEAMAYAVETINNRTDVLPGVQLGYEIRNVCDDEDSIAWTMMTMATSFGQNEYSDTCPNQNRTNSGKVTGIIGPSRSYASIIASKVARISAVPLVSFFSTSDELSDSGRFPFFFRTVPPDMFQVEVMADIMRYFNWRYIALFYLLDSYGINGARQIVRISEMYDICIAINMPVGLPISESDIEDIARKLSSEDKVNVIVAFTANFVGEAILKAITRMDNPRNFTFIGSDGWNPNAANLRDYVDVIRGGIFVNFLSEIPVTFQEYFRHLPYNQDQTSPWYQKKLNQISTAENCTNWTSCPVPDIHWNTQQVIRAVEVIAYALDATLRQEAAQNISSHQPVDGWLLRENLLNVSIPVEGENDMFRFDENGEVPGRYLIRNWQFNNGQYDFVEIGKWDSLDEPQLSLSEDKIQWNTPDAQVPASTCVEDCRPGYIEVPSEKKCCFGCQKCNDYAIVVRHNTTAKCQDCLATHWPDYFRTTCVPIEESFLEYRDPIVVILVAAACLGLILIIVAAIGYWHYSEHILIKASGRELSPINLFGLGLSCITILILNFLKPTAVACVICEIGISTSFCASFAPVLLKVNRIWRIFNLKPRKGVTLMFTSPQSQLFMVAFIIILQVVLSLISIPFGRSKPDLLFPPQRKPYLGIYCQFSSGFIISCCYNAVIFAASSYFAFRARRVPDNYNESKFIAVSVYSTILVCLAAVPFYAIANEVSQKVAALCVPLLLNAYLSLVCLYLPKMYAIRYDKEVNATRSWKPSTASVTSDADQIQKSSAIPSKSEVASEVIS